MLPWGELIKGAFWIALRNRHLWFFGLFAGVPTFSFQVSFPTDGDSSSPDRADSPEMIDPTLLVVIAVAVLLFFLVYVGLSALSHGALAQGVAAIHGGERGGFRATWRAGRASFWRMLGLGVLAALITFAAMIAFLLAVAIPAFGVVALVGGPAGLLLASIGMAVVFFAVLLPLFLGLTIVVQHAIRDLALRDAGVVEGLRGGWGLLRGRLGASVLLLLIQQALTVAAGFVVTLVVVVLAAPAILLLVSGAGGATLVAIVTGLLVLPLALAAYGAIGGFSHAFWTLAYLRLGAASSS